MEIRKISCKVCGASDVKLAYAHGGYGLLLCIDCLLIEMDIQAKEGKDAS